MVTIRCGIVSFPNIQAVLFDKDGTLARSEDLLLQLSIQRSHLIATKVPQIETQLLATFGVDNNRLNPAGLMAVGSRQENAIASAGVVAAAGWDWVAALEFVRAAFLESDRGFQPKAEQTPLIAGTGELLQRLAIAGIPVGILSADTTANVEQFVQHHGLADWVQLQMGVDGFMGKSDPNFLRTASQTLGVACEAILVVGDSQADIELARSLSAKSVGVTWGWSSPMRLNNADAVISDCNQFQIID